ncbi:MAG: alpha/beta hydrolase [Actinobacteria bacterium]|nr:alpha/beta hydrolase [Actinomycetota bacterium]MBU1942358.1 alpha/beta hydrolase [Actinomycetota bacterium]MBU2686352.1 alpha/beta hydrolase [Actinomycetota bacterium]
MEEEDIERYLYYPDRLPPGMPPPRWAPGAEEVWMEADDGVAVHGLWWGRPEGRPAVLFLHGNAQEVYSWSPVREDLEALDCGMLLIDYHGYGKSGGTPHEAGLYADGRAALEWLSERGIGPPETVLFGKSLGGAVACEIAGGGPFKGLVLESTFTSLASVARRLLPVAPGYTLAPGAYDSLSRLPGITCPVLVIHGTEDALIPFEEGVALFKAANEPKEFMEVEGAGHNDVSMVAGRNYGALIRHWLDGTEPPAPGGS